MRSNPQGAVDPRRVSRIHEVGRRLAWPAVLVLALAPRVWFLAQWPTNFDADEALVGVHAREILSGRFSLFLPGQSYMGSLQSLLAALFVGLFGPSATAVRLAPLLWLVPGYWVLRAWQGRSTETDPRAAAQLLTLFWMLPPAVLFLAGIKARGGYLESLVLGLLCIHLWRPRRRETRFGFCGRPLLAGGLLGLAIWTHDQAMLFVPAALLLGAIRIGTRFRRKPPPSTEGPTSSAAGVVRTALFAVGSVLGYLPLWLPRLLPFGLGPPGTEGTGWAPAFSSLARPSLLADLLQAFPAALTTGVRPGNALSVLLAVYVAVYLAAAVSGVADWIRASRRRAERIWTIDPGLTLTAWLAAGSTAVLLVTPEFLEDPQWFRYTLPLTPFLVLAAARGVSTWPGRIRRPSAWGIALLGAVAALSATPAWVLPQAALRPALVRGLRAEGRHEVIAGWELAYYVRLMTQDEILASSYTPPRFPEVNARVNATPEAWIVQPRAGWRPRASSESQARGGTDPADLAEAFLQGARLDPADPAIRVALDALDSRRTLYARFEPFPLLQPADFAHDWRGWPYRRPLEDFTAIVWDPRCPSPVPDSLLRQRLRETLATGRFVPVIDRGGWAVYRRAR